MDEAWQRPPRLVLRNTPQLHRRVTHFTNEDHEIVFDTSSVEPDSPLNSDHSLIDKRDHSKDTYSVREHHSDQSCPSLEESVKAQIESESKKRKSPTSSVFLLAKKARLDEGTGHISQSSDDWLLSAEIWQHIFALLPPKMLGRLLSVNRCFNSFLNPLSSYSCEVRLPHLASSLSPLQPAIIWQLSRRRFIPNMPTPLRDHTELQMWQLACQSKCQFCGITGQSVPSSFYDPSNGEYKHTGPRPIWSFALRSCESCLVDRSIKEVDLLLSSVPSCLIPALPFVFTSDSMHIIPSFMLQTGQVTLEPSITKIFLSSHVAAIQEEFASARAMGEATAEEWLKGLEGRGKENRADYLRWEKFEMSGGLLRMRQRLSSDNTETNSKNKKIRDSSVEKREDLQELSGNLALPKVGSAISMPPFTYSRENSRAGSVLEHKTFSLVNVPRSKTREKAEEMKAARRAEIERRAAELEPPLSARALALIPSFHAAIQITSPLDDTAWSLLKSRLIAQREDMDQEQHRNQEVPTQSRAGLKQSDGSQSLQRTTLEAKKQVDQTWDDAQAPLRARISILADQRMHNRWENGRKVTKESSLLFAVDVLLYVRRQFYEEIERDDAAARAIGQTPPREAPDGPYTRKLTLENMKWLFHVKVKPLTESYRKELFYCHGCEANNKLYGFEGVVQHYAAKHTKCLSLGSVVVHWRAEWPEVPPFHPKPYNLKSQRAGVPKSKLNGVLGPIPPVPRVQPFRQEGAIPNYGHPMPHIQYGDVPIQPLHTQISPYTAPVREYARHFQGQALQNPSNLYFNESTYHEPSGVFQEEGLYEPLQAVTVDVYPSHTYIPYQDHATLELQPPYHVPSPDAYHTKLEDITRNSRELWFSIVPVRELSGPVKIFVVIHHVFARFRSRFSEEPSLSLFIDGLSNSKEMRPIRNVNGLQCKACCLGLGITTTAKQDKELYSLPQLVKHFYQRHVEEQYAIGAPVLDWHTDMIHLPGPYILSNLGGLTKIDNRKLTLINSALSEVSASGPQLHADRDTDTPLLFGHKNSDRKRHFSTVHSSNKGDLTHQSHIRYKAFRDNSKPDLEICNVDKPISETARPNSSPTMPNDSGHMGRHSASKASHRSINEASIDIKTTSTTGPSMGTPSAQRPSLPISLPQSYDRELSRDAENDEDDDFDLIAGLESQLDRQASSIGQVNLLGKSN
ncbi:hypothetical protein GGR58DRAFT_508304 [Xylaria digitata]|nr:hypothetical protein GGR58DRAFT_508304 [Xylaria digitata]